MKRVLVTRAPHQASALADALRARGCEPVLIPTLEIVPPASWCACDAALSCLRSYRWAIFTSANAVEAFAHRLRVLNLGGLPPQGRRLDSSSSESNAATLPQPGPLFLGLRVAAIGPATARALAAIGVTADLLPPQAVADSLAAALAPFARQPDGSPTPMLWLRAEHAGTLLAEALQQAGAQLTSVAVYRNRIPQSSLAAVRALFAPGSLPDAITFTSSSSVENLLALLQAAGVPLPPAIPRISIGPVTSATLIAAGLPAHGEAAEPTVAALADATAQRLIR